MENFKLMEPLEAEDPIAAIDRAAEAVADSVVAGLSPAVTEALADPIVRAMMTADRVQQTELEGLLRTATQTLVASGPASRVCQPRHFCGAGGA